MKGLIDDLAWAWSGKPFPWRTVLIFFPLGIAGCAVAGPVPVIVVALVGGFAWNTVKWWRNMWREYDEAAAAVRLLPVVVAPRLVSVEVRHDGVSG